MSVLHYLWLLVAHLVLLLWGTPLMKRVYVSGMLFMLPIIFIIALWMGL